MAAPAVTSAQPAPRDFLIEQAKGGMAGLTADSVSRGEQFCIGCGCHKLRRHPAERQARRGRDVVQSQRGSHAVNRIGRCEWRSDKHGLGGAKAHHLLK